MARLKVCVMSFTLLRPRRNAQEGAHQRTLWQAAVFRGAAELRAAKAGVKTAETAAMPSSAKAAIKLKGRSRGHRGK
jgi:hypothetical protein